MIKTITLIGLLGTMASCAVRPIMQKSTKDGGRVLMLGSKSINNSNAIKDRDALINKKCKSGFEIVEEGQMPMTGIQGNGVLETYYDFKCN
jgi:hypothetical protein